MVTRVAYSGFDPTTFPFRRNRSYDKLPKRLKKFGRIGKYSWTRNKVEKAGARDKIRHGLLLRRGRSTRQNLNSNLIKFRQRKNVGYDIELGTIRKQRSVAQNEGETKQSSN